MGFSGRKAGGIFWHTDRKCDLNFFHVENFYLHFRVSVFGLQGLFRWPVMRPLTLSIVSRSISAERYHHCRFGRVGDLRNTHDVYVYRIVGVNYVVSISQVAKLKVSNGVAFHESAEERTC
jgi:hypothetical protein